ncbi:MAG: hypothetical protein ACJ74Y_08700 [Bryobacteraceae bacterium]
MLKLHSSAVLLLCLAAAPACRAQWAGHSEDPENFHIEVTGEAWLVDTGGQIQASGAPINLVNDLNAEQGRGTFYGQLVFKPARKHRIVIEGTPFSVNGLNSVTRSIVYRGQTFNVSQTVRSSASLDYAFLGYQYDVLSAPRGHLGFSVGAAYLGASGFLQAVETNTSASKTQQLVLPLAGTDFRIFPLPGRKVFEIEGGIRGMTFGDYGYFAEATGSGGVVLGPITLLAGYRALNTDIHVTSNGGSGVTARLHGPIFSARFRW